MLQRFSRETPNGLGIREAALLRNLLGQLLGDDVDLFVTLKGYVLFTGMKCHRHGSGKCPRGGRPNDC